MSASTKPLFAEVWRRITFLEGQVFRQIRGGEFSFECRANGLDLSRTNQVLARSTVEEAYGRAPFRSTTVLQDLRAPSYLYAILMDDRVRQGDW